MIETKTGDVDVIERDANIDINMEENTAIITRNVVRKEKKDQITGGISYE